LTTVLLTERLANVTESTSNGRWSAILAPAPRVIAKKEPS